MMMMRSEFEKSINCASVESSEAGNDMKSLEVVDSQETSVGDHGRRGLSTEEAEILYQEDGYNQLEHVEISPIKLFFLQFTGLMPYILEIACILALAIEDYIDFVIVFIILLSNGILGYSEEIKARNSLVSSFTSSFYFIVI
jgi:magnesium-transporting ATPase (P-type)